MKYFLLKLNTTSENRVCDTHVLTNIYTQDTKKLFSTLQL